MVPVLSVVEGISVEKAQVLLQLASVQGGDELGPAHAKAVIAALQATVSEYASACGEGGEASSDDDTPLGVKEEEGEDEGSSSDDEVLSIKKRKKGNGKDTRVKKEEEENEDEKQPALGSRTKSKGKVAWRFGSYLCQGTLLPAQETETHCFARTHKGKTKTLAKGKDYWWRV